MAFLIIIAFLFSTIGVICFIVKAANLSKKISANALTINSLQNELKKLQQQVTSQSVGASAAAGPSFTVATDADATVASAEPWLNQAVEGAQASAAASEYAPNYTPDHGLFAQPEAHAPAPQNFSQDLSHQAQAPSQPAQPAHLAQPAQPCAPIPDFTQPNADLFKLPPDFDKNLDASIFACSASGTSATSATSGYSAHSYHSAPSELAADGNAPVMSHNGPYAPKPAWARSGELKPVPLNTLRMSTKAAQKQTEARDAASLWKSLSSFVSGGHLWVAGGVLLLFIAFAMLLTYMASRGMFTIEMRIVTGALAGIVMLAIGWRFRERKPTYALILQGGGIGLLYMSVFAASKFTTLLSPEFALILISLLIPPTIILAIKQRSQPLAMFGLFGGFAAPILLSTDSGNYIALFTYYSVLNLAVLVIGRYKLWRGLNLLAFLCTFGVALVWTLSRYQPEMFATAEPFMLLFMAMFTWLGIQSAERRELSIKNFVDLPITLGAPFVGAIIQWRMFSHIEHGLAIVCLAFAAIYLILTFTIWKRKGVSVRSLAEGYLGLSVLLANLAIPLEMSAAATSAVWAAEGVLIYYFAARNASLRMKISGLLLHAAAAVAFILRDSYYTYQYGDYYLTTAAFRHSTFTGCLIIALSAIVIAIFASKLTGKCAETAQEKAPSSALPNATQAVYPKQNTEQKQSLKNKSNILSTVLIVWGFIWWFGGWWYEFVRVLDYPYESLFILCSVSALVGFAAARWLRCAPLAWAIAVPLKFAFLFTAYVLIWRTINLFDYDPLNILTYNFFENNYLWAWLLFFVSQAGLLYLTKNDLGKRLHAAWMFLVLLITAFVLICTGRAYTQIWGLAESWTSLAGILPALAFVLCLSLLAKQKADLPSPHRRVMLVYLPIILCAGTSIWFIGTLFAAGNPAPLPMYIPLLNPLDMQQAFCIAIIALWQLNAQKAGNIASLSKHNLVTVIDVMTFLWLTAMIARASHYFLDIPMAAVPYSGKFHLALLVLWGLYGIGHIVAGHKMPMRRVWLAGATLTIIDIGKLLLVDLAHTGTITRIVSFFIAGLILLFIGWVAPLPPASTKVNKL